MFHTQPLTEPMPGVGVHDPVGFPSVHPTIAPRRRIRCPRSPDHPHRVRRRWLCSIGKRTAECPRGTPCHTEHRSDTWVIPSLWRATPPVASEPSLEVLGSSPIPFALATSCVDLEPRPLPSTGVTRIPRYYGPIRHPTRPGNSRPTQWSLAGVRLEVTHLHRIGLPVLREVSIYVHAVAITPAEPPDQITLTQWPGPGWQPAAAAFPVPLAGRLPRRAFRGLHSVHSRYGLHVRQVAQGDPLHRRLQPIRHLLDCSDCYRLERPVAGWESHPLKTHAFHGAQRDLL